jgi:hypothetical protein
MNARDPYVTQTVECGLAHKWTYTSGMAHPHCRKDCRLSVPLLASAAPPPKYRHLANIGISKL